MWSLVGHAGHGLPGGGGGVGVQPEAVATLGPRMHGVTCKCSDTKNHEIKRFVVAPEKYYQFVHTFIASYRGLYVPSIRMAAAHHQAVVDCRHS